MWHQEITLQESCMPFLKIMYTCIVDCTIAQLEHCINSPACSKAWRDLVLLLDQFMKACLPWQSSKWIHCYKDHHNLFFLEFFFALSHQLIPFFHWCFRKCIFRFCVSERFDFRVISSSSLSAASFHSSFSASLKQSNFASCFGTSRLGRVLVLITRTCKYDILQGPPCSTDSPVIPLRRSFLLVFDSQARKSLAVKLFVLNSCLFQVRIGEGVWFNPNALFTPETSLRSGEELKLLAKATAPPSK